MQTSAPYDQVNVVFVYGAGNDDKYGGGLRYLQDECVNRFGNRIYSPRIIDHRELDTLIEALLAWSDPTLLIGHSCGGETVTEAVGAVSSEEIPYIMVIAPSIYCMPDPVSGNVERITQATSERGDFYNPRAEILISLTDGNNKTQLDEIYTGMSHLDAPYSDLVRDRLFAEIERALAGEVVEPIPPDPQPEPPDPEPEPPVGPAIVNVTVTYPSAQVEVVVEKKPTVG